MSNYEPCVDSTGATESSLLDEAALTESTYGDSRSLKMRQQLQAGMADLARTTLLPEPLNQACLMKRL